MSAPTNVLELDGQKYRHIVLGNGVSDDEAVHKEHLHSHFAHNAVRNTKYRWWSLVPKSLWNQFRRLANVYFLVMSVAMMVGNYTEAYDAPIEGINTLLTLLLTMIVTMCIEARDDCERAKKDREINTTETVRLHAGMDLLGMDAAHPPGKLWRMTDFRSADSDSGAIAEWKDIVVGDVVVVFKDGVFPADMLLLASAAPDGSCFVETKSIDGETNLKKRRPTSQIATLPGQHQAAAAECSGADETPARVGPFYSPSPCEAANAFLSGRGYIQCEHPNVHVDENPGIVRMTVDASLLKSPPPNAAATNIQVRSPCAVHFMFLCVEGVRTTPARRCLRGDTSCVTDQSTHLRLLFGVEMFLLPRSSPSFTFKTLC